MKVKIYLKRITAIIIGFCIVISVLFWYQENFCILNNGDSWRIRNFYKEAPDSLDVVVVGSSEVSAGCYPGIMYDKYGITNYNVSVDSASPKIWKSEVREILTKQKPKVILFEISGALYLDDKKIFDDAALRRFFDNIPFSADKISDLRNGNLKEDLFSYVFPLIKYHGDLGNAFNAHSSKKYYDKAGCSKLKGVFSYTDIDKTKDINAPSTEGKLNINLIV